MVEALRRNSSEQYYITDDEKLCLEIAGLCHDLGHGPLSHTWEKFLKAVAEREEQQEATEGTSNGSNTAEEWKVRMPITVFRYILKNV
jgi:HD superfamily phosphohydrolase